MGAATECRPYIRTNAERELQASELNLTMRPLQVSGDATTAN